MADPIGWLVDVVVVDVVAAAVEGGADPVAGNVGGVRGDDGINVVVVVEALTVDESEEAIRRRLVGALFSRPFWLQLLLLLLLLLQLPLLIAPCIQQQQIIFIIIYSHHL